MCPSRAGAPFRRRRNGVLTRVAVQLCAVLVLATLVSSQQTLNPIRTDGAEGTPPPGFNGSDGVVAAQPDPGLDLLDDSRYVRNIGVVNTMVYREQEAVGRVLIDVYFYQNTDERVSILANGQEIGESLSSQELQARAASSAPCTDMSAPLSNPPAVPTLCPIQNTSWFRVRWAPTINICSEEIVIRLSGSSTSNPVNIGAVALYPRGSSCESGSSGGLSIGIIAAVVAVAVVLLLVIGWRCWVCLKPRNDPGPYGPESWRVHEDHPMMHPMNQQPQPDMYDQRGQHPQAPSPYQYQSHPNQMFGQHNSMSASPSQQHSHSMQAPPSQQPLLSGSVGSVSVKQPGMMQLAENEAQAPTRTDTGLASKGLSAMPEAIKHSANTMSHTAAHERSTQDQKPNQLISISGGDRGGGERERDRDRDGRDGYGGGHGRRSSRHHPPPEPQAAPPQVDMSQSDDDDVDDGAVGPTPYDETAEEQPDPQQGAMLKDIHLQQAAGITEMIQGVKDNLMQMQTLKNRDGQADAGLEIFNKIGGGGFGEVFKGKYKGKDVAVKIMKIKPGAKQESLTELPYTEAAIAGICIHANIVQTMYSDLMPVLDTTTEGGGSFWSKAKDERASRSLARSDSSVKEWQVRMVMEICDLGSVRDWVSPAAGHKYGALYAALPNKAGTQGCGSRTLCALLTSLDVANGMKLLHKYKILHSDLKPHNVLLCSSHTDPRGFIAKLSDFGLSMKMAAHDGQVPGIKYGTVQYLAPEVLNTHIMTKKADVYSFGIIMWEVWHSRLFAEFYNNEKRKRKQSGQSMEDYRPMVSSKCPKSYVQLMTQCLDRNPDKRPDFLGGQVNIVVELERLIHEEYQKMAATAGR